MKDRADEEKQSRRQVCRAQESTVCSDAAAGVWRWSSETGNSWKMERCEKGRIKLWSLKSSPAPAVTGDAVNACCLFDELNSLLQCVCRFVKTADFLCED